MWKSFRKTRKIIVPPGFLLKILSTILSLFPLSRWTIKQDFTSEIINLRPLFLILFLLGLEALLVPDELFLHEQVVLDTVQLQESQSAFRVGGHLRKLGGGVWALMIKSFHFSLFMENKLQFEEKVIFIEDKLDNNCGQLRRFNPTGKVTTNVR